MSLLWLHKEWQEGDFKPKGQKILLHFLTQKMKIADMREIELIINNKKSIKTNLKAILRLFEQSNSPKSLSPSKTLFSPKSAPSLWVVRENDPSYIGWTVFDAKDLVLLINYGQKIPELKKVNTFKYLIIKDIGTNLFFNIFNQFDIMHFKYLNIGDVNTDLVNGISQLLALDKSQVYNYKSSNLVNTKTKNNKFSLITIFMNASHFNNIENMFEFIYEICDYGGYLLIREYDLPTSQRDKAFLYETFYNLYRILYREIDIDVFVKNMKPIKEECKIIESKYKTRDEWIEFISKFKFKPIASNIPFEMNHYYDSVYILFQKV